MEKRVCKLLIAATGSVAALKIPDLVKSVIEFGCKDQLLSFEVKFILSSGQVLFRVASEFNILLFKFQISLIVTEHAKHFFDTLELPAGVMLYDDESEWDTWKQRGDPVLHIELGKWADMMVIAPLDANTLAKMAQGICDNLITCTTRAWDMKKPLLFSPAMNTRMWEHPITVQQVQLLRSWGHTEIPPISKLLMCGDTGIGAMAEVNTIVEAIKSTALKL